MALALSLIGLSLSAAWVYTCIAALLDVATAAMPAVSFSDQLGIIGAALVALVLGGASFAFALCSSLKHLQRVAPSPRRAGAAPGDSAARLESKLASPNKSSLAAAYLARAKQATRASIRA